MTASCTRATIAFRAGTAHAALALSVCVLAGVASLVLSFVLLVLAPSAALAADGDGMTKGASLRALGDAQLATRVRSLEAEATSTGELLLTTDAERSSIVLERDAARDLLAVFIADSYKRSVVGGSMFGQLLASASVNEMADRVRVAQVIGEHHGSIIRSLDGAQTRLAVSEVQRARMIVRLSRVQSRLVALSQEQGRRAGIRAAHAEARSERARAARARTARAAVAAASTVPAASPGSGVPAGTLAGAGAGSTGGFVRGATGQPSAVGIDAYLASKASPMTGQGAAFMASGQRYQIDPRLLVAIAGAESSFGQITCGPYNAWGWACPNDPADFATWAAGIDTVMRGLRRYYLDEGRTSVSLIQQKYCPVGAANDPTGLNSHWTKNVTKFLIEQGGNPNIIGPGPAGSVAAPVLAGFSIASH